jgi:acetyl-CoA synthetase
MTQSQTMTATEPQVFDPPAGFRSDAGGPHITSMDQYKTMYDRSINDPEGFWTEVAEDFHWFRKWDTVRQYNYNVKSGAIDIKWFEGATTNITHNCLDRHLATRGDQTAIIWEGNDPSEDSTLTYKQLHEQVCKFANVLKAHGVKKGDRVSIYLPMIPELAVAMMACARIGAIHSIVFAGFSADSLADRIVDSTCTVLITADGTFRGKKPVDLKGIADEAVEKANAQMKDANVDHVFLVKRAGDALTCNVVAGRDKWWHDVMADASADCPCEEMDAEDPLFILYTSGSTGKPKGVQHTTSAATWSTPRPPQVHLRLPRRRHLLVHRRHRLGHRAQLHRLWPAANGATTIMFEGVPTYPDAGRFWDVVDKYKVTQFYTAPTAIRALMAAGEDSPPSATSRVCAGARQRGRADQPRGWLWYHRNIGGGRARSSTRGGRRKPAAS